ARGQEARGQEGSGEEGGQEEGRPQARGEEGRPQARGREGRAQARGEESRAPPRRQEGGQEEEVGLVASPAGARGRVFARLNGHASTCSPARPGEVVRGRAGVCRRA